jgi:hypothetical protein
VKPAAIRALAIAQRRLLLPFAVALVPLFWVVDATYRASLATLGRDQGIFQYIAWAVRQGQVDYRDVRDVNGPLIHLLHSVMMTLGGADEHRFHVIELATTGLVFAFAGFMLPGLGLRRAPRLAERLAWAAAAWVLLSGQYHVYLYWNQAQRESFCDWFLIPSVALQIATWSNDRRASTQRVLLIGALSVIPWFGKPTFAVFTVAQFVALMLVADGGLPRTRRAVLFAAGGALGSLLPVSYLLTRGDIVAFLRISATEVPAVYKFIWAKTAREMLGVDGPLASTAAGLACSALLLLLIAKRELPRRAMALALMPLAAVGNVIFQHKGFGYHFHPLTAFTTLGWLLAVVGLSERHRGHGKQGAAARYMVLAGAMALTLDTAHNMTKSPHIKHVWILAGGATPQLRQEREYFDQYKSYDFFPWEMRKAAEYLRAHTKEGDRVQTYGMDPYLLFLAGRLSATPYIYAYDLDCDAALEGGWTNEPTPAQADKIRRIRDEHERDLMARLRAAPPAAFVLIDHSPLLSDQIADKSLRKYAPTTAAWVDAEYVETGTFGPYHVLTRRPPP